MRYWLPSERGIDGKRVSKEKYRKDLAAVVRMLVDKGVACRNPRSIEWQINYHYLQGVRNFYIESFRTGSLRTTWESNEGQLQFRFEDALSLYQTELGVLLDLDVSPFVEPRKKSELDGLRKAAAAQVWLDHITGNMDLQEILTQQGEALFQYGTVGTGVFSDKRVSLEEGAYISTVPPWELLPVPAKPTRSGEAVGLIRHRWVPYFEVRQLLGADLEYPKNDNPGRGEVDPRLNIRWVPLGDRRPDDADDPERNGIGGTGTNRSDAGFSGSADGSVSDSQPYVELIEGWLLDYKEQVDRAVVQLGDWVARDTDFEGERPENKPCRPINVARALHSGGFWGRPWLSDLVVLNNEAERNWANLFKNVQEFDQFGTTLYPLNMGIQQHHLEGKSKPKAVGYEPDYMGMKFAIERLTPTNSGTMPMEIAGAVTQLMDRRASTSDLLRGDPKRLESAAGAGTMYEMMMKSRKAMIQSLANMWAGSYRSLLQMGRMSNITSLQLKTVDHRLAGIAVTSDGRVELDPSMLPRPDEVRIRIASQEPTLINQKKQEVMANFDRGLIQPKKLAWINHVKGLGMDLGMDGTVREIEQCMLHNLILFGDGKTPGTVTDPEYADHEIWSDTILEFMRQDAYRLAGDAVKQAFVARLQFHQQMVGGYPEQMPYPEQFGAGGSGAQLPPQLQKEMGGIQQKMAMNDLREAMSQGA